MGDCMATVEIPDEIDKLLTEVSKKVGTTKAEALKILLSTAFLEEGENKKQALDTIQQITQIPDLGGLSKEIKDILLAKLAASQFGSNGEGDDMWKALSKIISPVIMVKLLDRLFAPNIEDLILRIKYIEMLGEKGKENPEVQRILHEYLKQNEETRKLINSILESLREKKEEEKWKQLIETLRGRIEQVEKKNEEQNTQLLQTLVAYMDQLNQTLREIQEKRSHGEDVTNDINKVLNLMEAIENLKRRLNPPKQTPPVTKEGKLDPVAAIYNIVTNTIKEVGETIRALRQPVMPPQPQFTPAQLPQNTVDIKPLPPSPPQQVKEEKKVEAPKEVQKEKPKKKFGENREWKEVQIGDQVVQVTVPKDIQKQMDYEQFMKDLQEGKVSYVLKERWEDLTDEQKKAVASMWAAAGKNLKVLVEGGEREVPKDELERYVDPGFLKSLGFSEETPENVEEGGSGSSSEEQPEHSG